MAVFQRGRFTGHDAESVASLLQIYLLALGPACLGGITGRGFYVLKDTRTLAIFGSLESIAYVVYTALLSRLLGVVGVALGYAIYFNISIIWHVLVLRYKTGNRGGTYLLRSFLLITLAAALAGGVAFVCNLLLPNPWLRLIIGGVCGVGVYALMLMVMRVHEAQQIWAISIRRIRLHILSIRPFLSI
jgi:peptidoglycan biosynthesis protein MviN/MurJ (putative lipid II flippase)